MDMERKISGFSLKCGGALNCWGIRDIYTRSGELGLSLQAMWDSRKQDFMSEKT